ncbi:alpha/beta fold hydrolase [Massilia sp. ST3]|uniref:alpha/beta fold hydrolase n=1 Tax=Massilia sp. ST3 TaxID=2824903 RepID=UPI001B823BC8|nr:alpha/beta fold hydrolase [Massilia sp. ST3]MBQ5947923.1 alpha/beta fold hydrolase [Massilia sp. ST3]
MGNHSILHYHTGPDYRLASGAVLAAPTIAFRSMGRLDADGANAVLVLHGYTTGPAMLDPDANVAEGSWSELVGPGKPIDTDRYFVVCPNMTGSSYGSTGPGSIDPASGRPYGAAFPALALEDIVGLQKQLLTALGVRRLAAVAGPSFGAYQSFQWALSYPDFVERVVAAVGAPWHPNPPGAARALLEGFSADPAWPVYQAGDSQALAERLTAMRIETLTRYGVDAELAPRLPDPAERAREVARLAREWALGFDPISLVALMEAAEGFDLRGRLEAIRAPVLYVLSRSDAVFSPTLARTVARQPGTDRWSYVELDSDKGHFASGADAALWADELRRFMESAPAAWTPLGFKQLDKEVAA